MPFYGRLPRHAKPFFPRGHGLELHTQVQGQPTNTREAQSQLRAHADLLKALSGNAQTQLASLPNEPAPDKLHAQLALQATLSSLGAVQSSAGGSGGSSASSSGGRGSIPITDRPDIVLSAAADITSLAPAHTVITTGAHTTLTAGQDINLHSQRHLALAVNDGISLFTRGEAKDSQRTVQDVGLKLHAASGNVNVQAQSDAFTLTAALGIDIQSTAGSVLISAPSKLLINGGGLCEINNDVFGSRNTDQEFVGRKFGQRGIETGYSRIVHIGLSYGYIQYSQDGGGLGKLLARMSAKNPDLFKKFFPNPVELIQMTTDGLPDHDRYGKSGQSYWSKLSKADKQALQQRVNADTNHDDKADKPLNNAEQIRGARVQKIPYVAGYPAIELWEDYKELAKLQSNDEADHLGYLSAFKAAGEVPAFQDAQLDLGVEDYMNPILAHCRAWHIRSAIGLAFVTACAVRGGPGSSLVKLLSRVAKAKLGIDTFESGAQERACVQAIAKPDVVEETKGGKKIKHIEVAGVRFEQDEARRAGIILADHYRFLQEDLYDMGTYDEASDV